MRTQLPVLQRQRRALHSGAHRAAAGCPRTLRPPDLRPRRRAQVKMLFNSFGGQDFYDVIPDIYNIAVLVEPSDPACRAGGCTADLLQHCPETPATARVLDSAGKLIACNSACEAYRDLAHCRFSSAYQRAVKALCPSSATFANDDTQLLGCSGSPDYAITFCGLSTRAQ